MAGVAALAIVRLGPGRSKPVGRDGKSDGQNPAESLWWLAGFSCRVPILATRFIGRNIQTEFKILLMLRPLRLTRGRNKW